MGYFPRKNTTDTSVHTGGRIGATAGWVTTAAALDYQAMATMAASQTAGTLVIPLPNLKVGDVIESFSLQGAINSAGGAVTLDCQLRKVVPAAAAAPTDSLIASMTQLAVTAATAVSSANAVKNSIFQEVLADESYYLLATGTTAASTTMKLTAAAVVVRGEHKN